MDKIAQFRQIKAVLLRLIFALVAISVTPSAKAAGNLCTGLLTEIHYEAGVDEIVATLYGTGEFLGVVEFNYNEADKSLYIDIMSVMDGAKRRGVGSGLFNHIMLAHPEALLIDATLEMDNYSAFDDALRKTQSIELALKETPLYKMAARHGFTEIILRDSDDPKSYRQRRDIQITFSRPTT